MSDRTPAQATIRPARPSDLASFYRIALLTGDSGADATLRHADPDLLGHVYVGPYLLLDDTIGFAAVDDLGVAGYTLAALDTAGFEAACERSWWPDLRLDYADPGTNPSTPDEELRSLIHHPERSGAEVSNEYPAHLHIDLHPRLQGRCVGTRLIQTLLDELRRRSIEAVHLGVARTNDRAIEFYRRFGFADVATTPDSLVMGLRLTPVDPDGPAETAR